MAVNLSPVGGVAAQFFTNSGAVLTGGKIFTYAAGTTTPAATYTTSQGNVAWTNPIVLDAAGRVPSGGEIWLTDGLIYKFVLKNSNDVLIGTYDNITGINSNFVNYTNQQEIQTATAGQTVFTLTTMQYQPGTGSLSVFVDGVNQYGPGASYAFTETDSTTVTFVSGLHVGASVKFTTSQIQNTNAVDSSQVSYVPPFAGSVATNVEAKLAQTINALDFGAVADQSTDNTAAVQDALDALPSIGGSIVVPAGARFNLKNLTFPQRCNMQYYVDDDLSAPGAASDLGSGELVFFSSNSSYPTSPTGGIVNEWRFTAPFHPGIVVDVRKDVQGANAYLGPGQSMTEPVRASYNILDEQTGVFTVLYQNFSSNSNFSGLYQNTYRNIVVLNGVGSGDWPTLPSAGNQIFGATSGAAGFFISSDATSTTVLWFSGEFQPGEYVKLGSPLTTSTSVVTTAVFSTTVMPWLAQDFLRGSWSISLPPQTTTHSFAVGGKIAAAQSRSAGQYIYANVTSPAFVWLDSYENATPAGKEIVYDTTPVAAERRLYQRNLDSSVNRAHIGAVFAHGQFNDAGDISASAYNIATITKNGTGDYTVNFTNAAVRADFSVSLTTQDPLQYAYVFVSTTGLVRVRVVTTGTSTLVNLSAPLHVNVMGGDI